MKPNLVQAAFWAVTLLLPARYAAGPADASPYGPASPAGSAGLGLSYVAFLSGDALFRSADSEEWAALTPNLSLRVGDRLWAGDDARIEVRLPDAATAWLSYRSELDLVRLGRGPRGDTLQLALVSGEGSFDVRRFAALDSVFQVDLPGASVRAFGEAFFRVNALPDGGAQVGVVRGSVDLEVPDGLTTVRAGRLAELRPDGRVTLGFLPPADDWDEWVRSRAVGYDRPAGSVRYLPPDLYPYAQEFDHAGRWMAYAPYGFVWVPAVAPSWSPYANGRWVWMGGDYVWLSYDPWYAPFHYGRWNFRASVGWYWVPPRRAHWSPGYVAWSVTDSAVCWVPLGHGEVYYGYGDYGPDAVNVFHTTRIDVPNAYVNSRVTGGVVVVRRDDFLRGRTTRERRGEPENPFLRRGGRGATVLARPPVRELRPTRETRIPRPDVKVERRARPPARVERESEVIRNRPAARGRERSVFAPGRKPPPLRNVEKEPGVDEARPPGARPATQTHVPPGPERPGQPGPPSQPERRKQEQTTGQPPKRGMSQAPETRPHDRRGPPEQPAGPEGHGRPGPEPHGSAEVRQPGGRATAHPQPPKPERPTEPRPQGERRQAPERLERGSPAAPGVGSSPAPPSPPQPQVGKRPFRRIPEPAAGGAAPPAQAQRPKGHPEKPEKEREQAVPRGHGQGDAQDGERSP